MVPSSDRVDLTDELRAPGGSVLPVNMLIDDWVGPIGIHDGRARGREFCCSTSSGGSSWEGLAAGADELSALMGEVEARRDGSLDMTVGMSEAEEI